MDSNDARQVPKSDGLHDDAIHFLLTSFEADTLDGRDQ